MRFTTWKSCLVAGCLLLILTGCEGLMPANQQEMRNAVDAGDRAVRSEEKVWALVLRMEEMAQRMEEATARSEAAANRAEAAASKVEAVANRVESKSSEAALAAENARKDAENASLEVQRIQEQEGRSLQQILKFLQDLGYKP